MPFFDQVNSFSFLGLSKKVFFIKNDIFILKKINNYIFIVIVSQIFFSLNHNLLSYYSFRGKTCNSYSASNSEFN